MKTTADAVAVQLDNPRLYFDRLGVRHVVRVEIYGSRVVHNCGDLSWSELPRFRVPNVPGVAQDPREQRGLSRPKKSRKDGDGKTAFGVGRLTGAAYTRFSDSSGGLGSGSSVGGGHVVEL